VVWKEVEVNMFSLLIYAYLFFPVIVFVAVVVGLYLVYRGVWRKGKK
jgi:hypothetical protein